MLDVMFFPDKSKDVLPRFLEYFRAAKSSVEICVFTITSNDIADEVLRAHERGVRIRIISDDDQARFVPITMHQLLGLFVSEFCRVLTCS